MEGDPNLLMYLAHSTTRAAEGNANAILDQDHAIQTTTHEAMDGIAFPFLRLPVELQVGTMEHLSNYSDLNALCLVSKHISNIATPCLYSNVDLKKEEYQDEWLIEQRIKSLLIEPASLLFVRILKTPPFGKELTQLMDQVLPLLKKDFLLEFSFSTESTRCFPTPLQMQLLWASPKNLRNLKLYSHMGPRICPNSENSCEVEAPYSNPLLSLILVIEPTGVL